MPDAAYIYGIVKHPAEFELRVSAVGTARGDTGTVPLTATGCGSVAAIWTPCPDGEIKRTRRNLLAHTRVLEAAMAHTTVLPMRFGVVASDLEAITSAMASRQDELSAMLERFEGLSETGVRIEWDRDAMMRDLRSHHPELELQSRRLERQGGGTYQQRIDLGRAVADKIELWRKDREREAFARLKRLTKDAATKAPESDLQILRADFLHDTAGETQLMSELADIRTEHGDSIQIQCVGPAPLYNFVNLQLEIAAPIATPAA